MRVFIRMQIKQWCCRVSAILLFNAGLANADDASELVELLGGMSSFEAHFKQIMLDAKGNYLQQTEGIIAVKKPDLLYWKTEPPMEQLLVSDGEQLWFYDPELEQVTVQPLDHRVTQTPALLLSGDLSRLQQSYSISQEREEAARYFLLYPKDPDSLFEQLKLTFLNGRLVQMHLADSLGQRSSLEFMDPRTNLPLDDQLFRFTPPEGVDLIMQ